MRRIVVLSTFLLLLAAGTAWSFDGWFGGQETSVWGGGRYNLGCAGAPPLCPTPREFSLDAHAGPRGLGASGSFSWGAPQSGTTVLEGRVTCLHVGEDSAKWSIAGGFIDHVNPAFDGWVFFFYARDLGRAGSFTRDLAVLAVFDPALSPGLPEGFPARCPTLGEVPLGPRAPLDAGDVSIIK